MKHLLWSDREPYGPYICERPSWETCPDHKYLTTKRPSITITSEFEPLPEITQSNVVSMNDYATAAAQEPNERRYMLDPRDMEASLAKAEKIISKANRKGLDGGFKVVVDESNGYPELVVTGEAFKVNGWNFVASIERLPNGEAIIKKSPSYSGDDVEQEFLEKENVCQHCNKNRKRRVQVIVENGSQRLMVGSTCLKDFLGWDYVPSFIIDMDEIDEQMRGLATTESYSTNDILAITLAMTELYGFKSASAAANEEEGSISTKERVRHYINAVSREQADSQLTSLLRTKDFSSQVSQIKATVAEELKDKDSDYARNMKAAFTGDMTFKSTFGLVVSGVMLEEKRKVREATPKEVFADTIYAPIGNKVTVEVVVTGASSYETQYGIGHIYSFAGDGHRFKWFASKDINVEIGDKITITGTVKDVNVFKEQTSTMLTRCKVS